LLGECPDLPGASCDGLDPELWFTPGASRRITNLGDGCGWICSACAVRLTLDAIAAKQAQP